MRQTEARRGRAYRLDEDIRVEFGRVLAAGALPGHGDLLLGHHDLGVPRRLDEVVLDELYDLVGHLERLKVHLALFVGCYARAREQ
jgi:predicted nuclease with TOPRIM domain